MCASFFFLHIYLLCCSHIVVGVIVDNTFSSSCSYIWRLLEKLCDKNETIIICIIYSRKTFHHIKCLYCFGQSDDTSNQSEFTKKTIISFSVLFLFIPFICNVIFVGCISVLVQSLFCITQHKIYSVQKQRDNLDQSQFFFSLHIYLSQFEY